MAYYGIGRMWDYHREKKTDTFKVNTKTNGYIDSLDGTANIKLMMNWFRKKTVQMAQKNADGLNSVLELRAVYWAMETCFALITGYSNIKVLYNLDTNELDCYYSDETGAQMTIPLSQMSAAVITFINAKTARKQNVMNFPFFNFPALIIFTILFFKSARLPLKPVDSP